MGPRIRFGQFNIRDLTMEKLLDLSNPQVLAAAKIIKRFRPDVLSIDEMQSHPGAPTAFVENFLKRGEEPADYPFFYIGQTNSGMPTGLPYPYDYRGYGHFRGQYGIACLSRLRIDFDGIKNLKDVSWPSLPGSCCAEVFCPRDFPLWSTSFLDVPVETGDGAVFHTILVHPTVPLREYVNMKRNADQMRFLKSYIDGFSGSPFVVIGDLNADPDAGIGTRDVVRGLFEDDNIIYRKTSRETFLEGGGVERPPVDGAGLLKARLDYILPSRHFRMDGPLVFAPEGTPWWQAARRASDHFFVYADCELI